MVEVFKTNIERVEEAERIRKLLLAHLPNCRINLDLEDCDRILRIEGKISSERIIEIVGEHNYKCEVLK
jgi:hypothetical protein